MCRHTELEKDEIPNGYRQGFITAITVLLAFSLGFFQFWTFGPEPWTVEEFVASFISLCSIGMQLYTLCRSVQLKDNKPCVYNRTLKWFYASVVVLVLGVLVATLWDR